MEIRELLYRRNRLLRALQDTEERSERRRIVLEIRTVEGELDAACEAIEEQTGAPLVADPLTIDPPTPKRAKRSFVPSPQQIAAETKRIRAKNLADARSGAAWPR